MNSATRKLEDVVVYQRDDGYINVTHLCKAYEQKTGISKRTGKWFETSRAKSLIKLVSERTSLTDDELVQINKGGTLQQRGTLVHPDLAIAYASSLCVEFELEVTNWIIDWKSGTTETKDNKAADRIKSTPKDNEYYHRRDNELEPSLYEVQSLFNDHLAGLDLDPRLLAKAKIEAVARSIPRLAKAADEARKLVDSVIEVEFSDRLMSAAQVGEKIAKENGHKFGYGAMLINSVLEREGFQVVSESFDATGQQILRWKLTELGERYGETINRTSDGKVFYAIRWFSSIVPILQRYFPKKYD